jgi:hypothetical protein
VPGHEEYSTWYTDFLNPVQREGVTS